MKSHFEKKEPSHLRVKIIIQVKVSQFDTVGALVNNVTMQVHPALSLIGE